MSVEVTVVSTAEDKFFSTVLRRFYFDDGAGISNPKLDEQFVITSRWRGDPGLERKLHAIRRQAGSDDEVIRRLDIVGHGVFKQPGSPEVVAMAMDDDAKNPSIGLTDECTLRGLGSFEMAFQYCTPDVQVRMLLCEGDELPPTILDSLYWAVKAARTEGSLWITKRSNSVTNFGLGGFVDRKGDLLTQYVASTRPQPRHTSTPVRSPLLRDGYD